MKTKKMVTLYLTGEELDEAVGEWVEKHGDPEIVKHIKSNHFSVDVHEGEISVLIDGELDEEEDDEEPKQPRSKLSPRPNEHLETWKCDDSCLCGNKMPPF